MTDRAKDTELRKVFVISPIDKTDDDGVAFTEIFLEHIVKPAVSAAGGYEDAVRADEVPSPGPITPQIIKDIVAADVCIADITGDNPNVMYEIAIAHAADKIVILMRREGGGGSFDIKDERVIPYGLLVNEAHDAKELLTLQLKTAQSRLDSGDMEEAMNPVRAEFRKMRDRENARKQDGGETLVHILERLESMEAQLSEARMIQRATEMQLATRIAADRHAVSLDGRRIETTGRGKASETAKSKAARAYRTLSDERERDELPGLDEARRRERWISLPDDGPGTERRRNSTWQNPGRDD